MHATLQSKTNLKSVHQPKREYVRQTKIVATIGPATNGYEAICQLIAAGVNCVRINFSHGTHEEHLNEIAWIRQASTALHEPVMIIQDLQGSKIRLGDFAGSISVKQGETLSFAYNSDYAETGHIPVQYDLANKVKKGERLYLFDGTVRTIITSVKNGIVYTKAKNSGTLLKRKGINLPDTDFQGDILTKKDMADIRLGASQNIDFVALSFVQVAEDVQRLRRILRELGSHAQVMAKIETQSAVDNIESIVEAADAIMIARGDLAIETSMESVPIVQRRIIRLGHAHTTPTIVATQMLVNMVEKPTPTRAEVSDVAHAVFMGADYVMLSDETANGKYPIETVKMMERIISYSEQN